MVGKERTSFGCPPLLSVLRVGSGWHWRRQHYGLWCSKSSNLACSLSRWLWVLDRWLRQFFSILALRRKYYAAVDSISVITFSSLDGFIALVFRDGCKKKAVRSNVGTWRPFWVEANIAGTSEVHAADIQVFRCVAFVAFFGHPDCEVVDGVMVGQVQTVVLQVVS